MSSDSWSPHYYFILFYTFKLFYCIILDIKPGDCPVFATSENCNQECRKDSECPNDHKCCYNGCGTQCSPPRSEEPVTHEPHFPESPGY